MVVAPNKTNPVEAPGLPWLLRKLADHLPGNASLGLSVVGLLIEPVDLQEGVEFDPATGASLAGECETCYECGLDYPRADLAARGHIYCANCRKG